MRLAIVGGAGGTKIGDSFRRAALKMGLQVDFANSDEAYAGPALAKLIGWHVLDHRPARLRKFGEAAMRLIMERKSDVLVATGLAPLPRDVLDDIGRSGTIRINYLTDDPWNPEHRSGWFLDALSAYDVVVTPRRSNMGDLQALGCRRLSYLPFGYDEDLFAPPAPEELLEYRASFPSDICFAGGADPQRAAYIEALANSGMSVALYGSYWERYKATRRLTRGQVPPDALRRVLSGCKIALCLVRRSNRDGNSMRTFELAALGACMLVERTEEHEELFGQDGRNVVYFDSMQQMVERATQLLGDAQMRQRIAGGVQQLVAQGGHTYADRLRQMLELVGGAGRGHA